MSGWILRVERSRRPGAIAVDIASSGGLKKLMGHQAHAVNPNKDGGNRPDTVLAFEYEGTKHAQIPSDLSAFPVGFDLETCSEPEGGVG